MKHTKSLLFFIKNQRIYLISFFVSTLFILGIIWLDGYRNSWLLVYAVVLNIIISIVFLLVTFYRQRSLYRVLQNERKKVPFEVIQEDESRLSKQVFKQMNQQYTNYHEEISIHKDSLADHQTFMYQWVHQMKTPIAVLELMAEGNHLEKNSVLEETDRLKEGLDLALNMARLESFNQDFVINQVNLKKVVTKVINEQKRNLIRHQIYPKITINEDLKIESDEKWLSFCLTQILLNSVKYTELEETRLFIEVEETRDVFSLTVTDFGMGITQEDLPKIFQPFFTGKRGRKSREATGMGLYLVKKALDKLDHDITITSVVGEGTVVKISFDK